MQAVPPMHITLIRSREAGFGTEMAVSVKGGGGWIERGVVVDGCGGDADDSVGGDGGAVVEGEVVGDVAAECHCSLDISLEKLPHPLRGKKWTNERPNILKTIGLNRLDSFITLSIFVILAKPAFVKTPPSSSSTVSTSSLNGAIYSGCAHRSRNKCAGERATGWIEAKDTASVAYDRKSCEVSSPLAPSVIICNKSTSFPFSPRSALRCLFARKSGLICLRAILMSRCTSFNSGMRYCITGLKYLG